MNDVRKLIVHRRKQFVAAAMKVRICVSTKENGDIKFTSTNLKVLGVLKNGKSFEVEIPEDSVDVYVVYDKLLPQKFHNKYSLKTGESDEVLYTYSSFNPFKGNPFTISPRKVATQADKLRVRKEAKEGDKSKFSILYWLIVIGSAAVGAVVGFSIFS